MHPDGRVTGKITYQRVNLATGRPSGPEQVMAISGTYTGTVGEGTFTATLRNADNTEFPDALKGNYTGQELTLSGGISEENVITADTSFKAVLKRR